MAASRKFPSFHFHIPYHSGVCVCVCFFFSSVFSSASCSFVFCFCILYDVHHLIFILFRLCSCEFMHVYECLKPPQGIDANEICMWAFFDVQQLSTFTFRQLTTDILLCFVSCISKRNKQVKEKNLKLPLRTRQTVEKRHQHAENLLARTKYCGFFTNYLILITIN